ncbi:hypothetical protein [Curtobacterium citri]|uniref:hypothetical protein n=1 Tax=Curtobacterium citri TaxID=3055139 RepID=UPI0025A02160|nr:hypothetical protein [Curtobacterium citri]
MVSPRDVVAVVSHRRRRTLSKSRPDRPGAEPPSSSSRWAARSQLASVDALFIIVAQWADEDSQPLLEHNCDAACTLATTVDGAEDDEEATVNDLDRLNVSAEAVTVGISAPNRTPCVSSAVSAACRRLTTSMSVACHASSAACRKADIAIAVVAGRGFIARSTRRKASTAQKLVPNVLTTRAMMRSNKMHGIRTVDVRPTNGRRVASAISSAEDVTNAAYDDFAAALTHADGEVKTALAMILTGLSAPNRSSPPSHALYTPVDQAESCKPIQ